MPITASRTVRSRVGDLGPCDRQARLERRRGEVGQLRRDVADGQVPAEVARGQPQQVPAVLDPQRVLRVGHGQLRPSGRARADRPRRRSSSASRSPRNEGRGRDQLDVQQRPPVLRVPDEVVAQRGAAAQHGGQPVCAAPRTLSSAAIRSSPVVGHVEQPRQRGEGQGRVGGAGERLHDRVASRRGEQRPGRRVVEQRSHRDRVAKPEADQTAPRDHRARSQLGRRRVRRPLRTHAAEARCSRLGSIRSWAARECRCTGREAAGTLRSCRASCSPTSVVRASCARRTPIATRTQHREQGVLRGAARRDDVRVPQHKVLNAKTVGELDDLVADLVTPETGAHARRRPVTDVLSTVAGRWSRSSSRSSVRSRSGSSRCPA